MVCPHKHVKSEEKGNVYHFNIKENEIWSGYNNMRPIKLQYKHYYEE